MKGILKSVSPYMLAVVFASLQISAHASAECKGKIEADCKSSSSCLWVNGYVTKTGTNVTGYCRVKSSISATIDSS